MVVLGQQDLGSDRGFFVRDHIIAIVYHRQGDMILRTTIPGRWRHCMCLERALQRDVIAVTMPKGFDARPRRPELAGQRVSLPALPIFCIYGYFSLLPTGGSSEALQLGKCSWISRETSTILAPPARTELPKARGRCTGLVRLGSEAKPRTSLLTYSRPVFFYLSIIRATPVHGSRRSG